VPRSVLEAIQLGVWDFEPRYIASSEFEPTDALPGTERKVTILAERVRTGLPLWHPADRHHYAESDED